MPRILLNSFTAGELSPKLEGRTDLPNLAHGCRRLRNFLPRVTGGAFRRPGLLFAWPTKDGDEKPSCLIPFNYSSTDSVLLEMGDGYLRFGRNGVLQAGINPSLPYEIVAPWTEDELFQHQYVQINDIMWLAHPSRPPLQLTRVFNNLWQLESIHDLMASGSLEVGGAWPAMLDENVTAAQLSCDHTTGSGILTATADTFLPGHEGAFFQIAHRREIATDELVIPIYPAASDIFTLTEVPLDGQKEELNGVYYTWKTTPTAAYEMAIGTGGSKALILEDSVANFIAAVNVSSLTTAYGPGTAQHPDVVASDGGETSSATKATGTLTATSGADFTDGNNVEVRIDFAGFAHTYKFDSSADQPYEVREAATLEQTLKNLVAAINLTGLGNSTDYAPGTTVHSSVTASMAGPNQVLITAKTGGEAGNALTLVVLNSSGRLTASAATLTGGSAGASYKMRVEARTQGSAGNVITASGARVGVLTGAVTNPANNSTVVAGGVTYTFKTALTPAANEVLRGAGTDATLLNLARAINLTGTPGTDYGAATVINPVVFANETISAAHELFVSSKTTNPTATATTETDANLSWGSATLFNPWATPTLTGGTEIDLQSDGIEILGEYKIYSYGIWSGTVMLERQNPAGAWEIVRQWTSRKDRNVIETGIAESPEVLRLRVVDGTGAASSTNDAPRFVLEASDARIYGLVRVTTVNSPTEAQVDIIKALFNLEPTTLWREGAWSDVRGYPSGVCIHDQRLIFFGSVYQPQTFWASATGDFLNFRSGVYDADSISAQLASEESSPIVWGRSVGSGLIVGKESEEWLVVSSDGQTSITPSNFRAKRESTYGAESVPGIVVGPRLLYVMAGGRAIMEYAFAYDEQAFYAVDLTELAEHLTKGGIKQMAFQRKPDSILWIVTSDGKLLSLTYRRDKQMVAIANHPMSGTVESVACINGPRDLSDLYIIISRTIGGAAVRFVEKMDMATTLELEEDDIDSIERRSLLTYLDCSKRQTGSPAQTSWGGLSHLEGHLVSVQADGSYHAPVRVTGGNITLGRAASTILVGLDYAELSEIVPMPVDLATNEGTSEGGKKRVCELNVRFWRTSAAQYADNYVSPHFYGFKLREATAIPNLPVPVVTEIKAVGTAPTFRDDLSISIRPTNAEPCNILALMIGIASA